MSIRDRLFNVARAELKSAGKKIGGLFEGSGGDEDEKLVEEELKRMEREDRRTAAASGARSEPRRAEPGARSSSERNPAEPPHIRKYYANLELPIGAPLSEVKASYRRLMRRYHPDLHQQSSEQTELATRLAQELRVAYDGLVAYLEPRTR